MEKSKKSLHVKPKGKQLSKSEDHLVSKDQPNKLFHSNVEDTRVRAMTANKEEGINYDDELGIDSPIKHGSPFFALQDNDSSSNPGVDEIMHIEVKGQEMKKKGKGKQLVGFEGNKIEEEEDKKIA